MSEVETILRDKGIHFVPKGKDVLVKCFNPEHDDSHPSMRIDRMEGQYHCLSCGWKGNVFHDFNKYRNVFNSKVSALKDKIRSLYIEASGVEQPSDAFPFYEPFRGLKAETYRELNAFTSEKDFPERVVFPIMDYSGKVKGFNARHKLTNLADGVPKYLVKPDGVDLPLYPPIKDRHTSMVLVEGLYDALNLRDKGLTNAVCAFGTRRLSANSIYEKMLPFMIRGIVKVYIMFDGDEAGRKAAEDVKWFIKQKTDLEVEIIPMGDGKDPGDLTQAEVDFIKKVVD